MDALLQLPRRVLGKLWEWYQISDVIFVQVVNMSITAAIVILVILGLRLVLRRLPKKYSYALWAVAAFRLACPVSFSSVFSLLAPLGSPRSGSMVYVTAYNPSTDNYYERGWDVGEPVSRALNLESTYSITFSAEQLTRLGAKIWLIGMGLMIVYMLVSSLCLRFRLRTAIRLEGNVWQSDEIRSPFILGLLRPRIYIPYGLKGPALEACLAHERVHLKRRDHVVKLLAFLLVTLHWFNPLVWVGYYFMTKDMEMACDEAVLRKHTNLCAVYADTMLAFAANHRIYLAAPLAFGERNVKSRIQRVLNWKRPAAWVTAAAVALCVLPAAALAANPLTHGAAYTVVGEYTGSVGAQFRGTGKECYEMGLNAYGRPVFRDPEAAYREFLTDYAAGIALTAKTQLLPPLTQYTYGMYKTWGWQVETDSDWERAQCSAVTAFFDIYENSFDEKPAFLTNGQYAGTFETGPVFAQKAHYSSSLTGEPCGITVELDGAYHLKLIDADGAVLFRGTECGGGSFTIHTFAWEWKEWLYVCLGSDGACAIEDLVPVENADPEGLGCWITAACYTSDESHQGNAVEYTVYSFNGVPMWLSEGYGNRLIELVAVE